MRLLMIDDHLMFLEGLRNLLAVIAPQLQVDCVASPDDPEIAPADYELVLLDWHLASLEGDQSIEGLRSRGCAAPIVVLSGETSPNIIERAIELGAAGFIPKHFNSEMMVAALEQVLSGRVFLPADDWDPSQPPRANAVIESDVRLASLTPRQLDVYRAASRGLSNKEIARELGIAGSTVKSHLAAVFDALGVHNRTEAAYQASREGTRIFPPLNGLA